MQQINVDYAPSADRGTLNVWRVKEDSEKELRFSIDSYILRSNFGYYIKEAAISEVQLLQDAAEYGELLAMMCACFMQECSNPLDKQATEHFHHYSGPVSSGVGVSADRELTDREKFMCALLSCDGMGIGLTSKMLNKLYGWNTYKSRKVAATVPHKYVSSLFSEERTGYFGKGWFLINAVHTLVMQYVKQVRPFKAETL